MTMAPSPADINSPALDGGGAARVERLEFGKFCVDPDGPVERDRENVPIEHGQLGWSSGFPDELVGFCDPSIMGASAGELDPLPRHCDHGTIMRPVVPGGAPRSVFYRVRTRPEAGENQAGRRYIMARYTVAGDDGVSPLALLNAMDDEKTRLRGVTREEAAALSALVVSAAEPVLGHAGEAFCRGALVYLLSGIPVSITEGVTEREFFSWVAALWALLPPSLRVHLSAGWGVGNSFSGRLAVTHTSLRAPECALFSASDPATSEPLWTPPTHVTVWDENLQPVPRAFFERRLEPGRSYTKYFFQSDADSEWPVSPPPAFDAEALDIVSSPDFPFPELPDWHEEARLTIRAFRYPGLKVKDEFTFLDIQDWLKTGQYEAGVLPLLDLGRSMTYESTREKTLPLMLEALAHPDSRPRGDRALWSALSGQHPDSFARLVMEARGPWSARARLLAVLSSSDTLGALRFLALAAGRGEADDLLGEVEQRLHECLDDSVALALADAATSTNGCGDNEYLVPHVALLRLQMPPAAYRHWLERRGLRLMGAFVAWREYFGEAPPSDILRIAPAADCHAFYEMAFGVEAPHTALAAVRSLSEEQFQTFADVFNLEWSRSDAKRRNHLLAWFDALGLRDWFIRNRLLEGLNPLLVIYANYPPPETDGTPDEQFSRVLFVQLVDEVAHGVVPQLLTVRVAAFYLEHWRVLHHHVTPAKMESTHLRRLAAIWPRPYAAAFGFTNVTPVEPVPAEVEHAASRLQLSPEDLYGLIAGQSSSMTFESAQFYWDEAQKWRPRPHFKPNAAELCWYLEHGELPTQPPANFPADLDNFVRVAHAAKKSELLRESAQRLWREAERGWQLRLLLSLFPSEPFEPTPAHLGLLLYQQEWLIGHLQHVNSLLAGNFYVATLPFHSLSYRLNQNLWKPGFNRSPIWAAFRGVPLSELPKRSLYDALRVYRWGDPNLVGDERRPMREDRARLCHTFLDGYSGSTDSDRSASCDQALRRVLYEFVLPELAISNTRKGTEQIFWDVESGMHDPYWEERANLSQRHGPTFYSLLQRVFSNYGARFIQDAVHHYFKRR